MEAYEYKVWYIRKRAEMDACVGWIGDILRFADLGAVRIPNTGGLFLLAEMDVSRQTGYTDFSARAGNSPGYSTIITGSEAPTLFVSNKSHNFIFYPKEKLSTLFNTLFIEHGHFQHA